jgi:hypothetical protein
VIYAIAAYSITIGVLALYLVLLQHRRRESADDVARQRGLDPAGPQAGFNAGALLLAPIWMMAHGMQLPGTALLVPCLAVVPLYLREMWIPLLFVSMVPLAAGAALGFIGNRIAFQHTGLERAGALSASQLPWVWYFAVGAS